MGNIESNPYYSIRLKQEEERKLVRFIFDSKGNIGSSLHFVILEGDCVLITITRVSCDSGIIYSVPNYIIRKCFVRGNKLEFFESNIMSDLDIARKFDRHVNSSGVMAIEDPKHEALDIFMSFKDDEESFDIRSIIMKRLNLEHNL